MHDDNNSNIKHTGMACDHPTAHRWVQLLARLVVLWCTYKLIKVLQLQVKPCKHRQGPKPREGREADGLQRREGEIDLRERGALGVDCR
jgi:hypothetical protein